MLTAALIRLAEKKKEDPRFLFNWNRDTREAVPPSEYTAESIG